MPSLIGNGLFYCTFHNCRCKDMQLGTIHIVPSPNWDNAKSNPLLILLINCKVPTKKSSTDVPHIFGLARDLLSTSHQQWQAKIWQVHVISTNREEKESRLWWSPTCGVEGSGPSQIAATTHRPVFLLLCITFLLSTRWKASISIIMIIIL